MGLLLFAIVFLDMPVLGHWLLNGQDELLRLVMINQLINQSINQSTHPSINQSVSKSISQSHTYIRGVLGHHFFNVPRLDSLAWGH